MPEQNVNMARLAYMVVVPLVEGEDEENKGKVEKIRELLTNAVNQDCDSLLDGSYGERNEVALGTVDDIQFVDMTPQAPIVGGFIDKLIDPQI